MRLLRRPSLQIPCEFHGEGDLLLCRLDVSDVEDPDLAGTIGVCLGEFCGNEGRGERAEPYPAGRVSVVRQMVVYSSSAFPLHLFRVAEVAGVSMLVVRPQESDLVRNIQACMVCIKDFFVCAQYLWDFLDWPVDVSA